MTACAPLTSSATTLGTSSRARFNTTVGRCLAIVRSAESDILEPLITHPSTTGMRRSSAARSLAPDSRESTRTISYPASAAASWAALINWP